MTAAAGPDVLSVTGGILRWMGTHFFIDETKAKGYVVVAVACPDASLAAARRAIGRLVLPGQRSIHMKHESSRRRAQIADSVAGLRDVGIGAIVVDAGRGPSPEYVRRDRALRAVVERAATSHAAVLVLDLDHTLVARDARTLSDACRTTGVGTITYSHQALSQQPLLALPDVVAWCWARGGSWRRAVSALISSTIQV